MKAEIQFEAVSCKHLNGSLTLDEINKLAKLNWLAMGIYQYLTLHGPKSVLELGHESPTTPFAVISKGLQELIDLGLVAEVVEAEVAEEVSNG